MDYYSYNPPHNSGAELKTVQMTLDDELVTEVDKVVERLQTSRSAFTRKALREALIRYATEQLESKHRRGYERHPVSVGEFSIWESEQAWDEN